MKIPELLSGLTDAHDSSPQMTIKFDASVSEENRINLIEGLRTTLEARYSSGLDREGAHHALLMSWEAVTNAAKHGNLHKSGKLVILKAWFGENDFLIGARDEGTFYSDPETKRRVEAREHIQAADNGQEHNGCGFWTIGNCAEIIHVDCSQNALFLGRRVTIKDE